MTDEKCLSEYQEKISKNINEVLSKKQFKEIFSFIKTIEPHFNDFCIIDGRFRLRTNDRTCVIEAEFDSLRNVSFAISDLKLSIKMLSVLNKNTDISVSVDNNLIAFSDQRQNIQFEQPSYAYLDNKFVSDEEMENIFFSNIDPNRPFIQETVHKTRLSNIVKVGQLLNSDSISIRHEEDNVNKGYISIADRARGSYNLKLKKEFLSPMKEGHYLMVTSAAFTVNKADLDLDFHFDKKDEIIIVICHTSIDDLQLHIYARSALLEE